MKLKTFESYMHEDYDAQPQGDQQQSNGKVYYLFVFDPSPDSFSGEVRDADGKCIMTLDAKTFDDGAMQHADDLTGLRAFLIGKKKLGELDVVEKTEGVPASNQVEVGVMAENTVLSFGEWVFESNQADSVSQSTSVPGLMNDIDQQGLPQNQEEIPGGLASGKTIDDIANKHSRTVEEIEAELEKGAKVEMEHTNDPAVAREIAMDHLWEMPDYYTKLATIEKPEEK